MIGVTLSENPSLIDVRRFLTVLKSFFRQWSEISVTWWRKDTMIGTYMALSARILIHIWLERMAGKFSVVTKTVLDTYIPFHTSRN